MNLSRFLTILSFIFLAILSRFLPHPPNFTAVNAIALFSAVTIGNSAIALFIVYSAMFLSDLVFGLHSQMAFVYFSLGLTILLNRFRWRIPVTLIISSLLFFVIVNLGVWLFDGIYSLDKEGLILCYIAALPFLANQLLGDLFYGLILFGLFSLSQEIHPAIPVTQKANRLSSQ